MSSFIVTADSTADLTPALYKRFHISGTMPLHIVLGESTYSDGVDITPEEIYRNFEATGTLPKTAAVNVQEYKEFFKKLRQQGKEVVHINLGSALSSTHQNAVIAAREVGGVYAVDSCNLSTGTGHLVIEAALLSEQGVPAKKAAEQLRQMACKVHSSFIIDKLNYLRAGGRCSTLAMLGANLLQLKPCIEVNNEDGSMDVGKKYRGRLDDVLVRYVDDKLVAYENIRTDKIFITHAGIGDSHVQVVMDHLSSKEMFREIFITRASCTISSHCGPGTLGILFMTE